MKYSVYVIYKFLTYQEHVHMASQSELGLSLGLMFQRLLLLFHTFFFFFK